MTETAFRYLASTGDLAGAVADDDRRRVPRGSTIYVVPMTGDAGQTAEAAQLQRDREFWAQTWGKGIDPSNTPEGRAYLDRMKARERAKNAAAFPAAPTRPATLTPPRPATPKAAATRTRSRFLETMDALNDFTSGGMGFDSKLIAERDRSEVLMRAYHESGHVAGHLAIGSRITRVSIERGASVTEAQAAGATAEDIRNRLMATAAGVAAVRELHPGAVDDGGHGDRTEAAKLVKRITGTVDAAGEILAAERRAAGLMSCYQARDAVRAVAVALLRCRTLTGAEAERIARDAAGPGFFEAQG